MSRGGAPDHDPNVVREVRGQEPDDRVVVIPDEFGQHGRMDAAEAGRIIERAIRRSQGKRA